MKYHDLRDFIAQLEKIGEQARERTRFAILEVTEICDRVLRAQSRSAVRNVTGHSIPVLVACSAQRRVAME